MTFAHKIENNRDVFVMHLGHLEVPMASPIPDGENLLILAYFGWENAIVADFPLCLAVVVDSNFGTTGGMCLY